MPLVAGVDGCRVGWFVAMLKYSPSGEQDIRHMVCPTYHGVLRLNPAPDIIAIDIPIGLLDDYARGGRDCDREARKRLGRPRFSSVFSPPTRRNLSGYTRHMSRQTIGILPKIREVDEFMTSRLQERIYEVHPELCFLELAGRPMKHNKRGTTGREERLQMLIRQFPDVRNAMENDRPSGVGCDDFLDAYAAAWTAKRIQSGVATWIPQNRPKDSKGLQMVIWS